MNLSDSISLCAEVLLPTTSTYSSASSTVITAHSPGMARLPPALMKSLQATDHCTPKSESAETHAFSMRTDPRFSNLAFSAVLCTLLNRDIKGITGKFSLTSSSNLSDALTPRWADVFYNHNTLLRSDWRNFLLVQIEPRGYQTIKLLHGVYTYFILYPYFSYFDGFVCQQKHQHDISRIRWRMELKVYSFQIFNSLSYLITNIL